MRAVTDSLKVSMESRIWAKKGSVHSDWHWTMHLCVTKIWNHCDGFWFRLGSNTSYTNVLYSSGLDWLQVAAEILELVKRKDRAQKVTDRLSERILFPLRYPANIWICGLSWLKDSMKYSNCWDSPFYHRERTHHAARTHSLAPN